MQLTPRWAAILSKAAVAAPTTLAQLKALLATSAKSAIWTPTDLSTAFSDSGVTPVTSGGGIKQLNDVSGNDNHMSQATSGKRPVATNGLTFDTLDDWIGTAASYVGSADMTIVAGLVKNTNGIVTFVQQQSSISCFLGVGQSGSGSASSNTSGTPAYYINGTAVPGGSTATRGQLYTAWPTTRARFEARNANLSGWAGFGLGFYTSFNGLVQASAIVLIDNAALGATNAAAALALAQQLIDTTNGALP